MALDLKALKNKIQSRNNLVNSLENERISKPLQNSKKGVLYGYLLDFADAVPDLIEEIERLQALEKAQELCPRTLSDMEYGEEGYVYPSTFFWSNGALYMGQAAVVFKRYLAEEHATVKVQRAPGGFEVPFADTVRLHHIPDHGDTSKAYGVRIVGPGGR